MALTHPEPTPRPGSAAAPPNRRTRPGPRTTERILLELIAAAPGREWRGVDLVERSGLHPVDVMVGLAGLAQRGRLERVGPGRYRLPQGA